VNHHKQHWLFCFSTFVAHLEEFATFAENGEEPVVSRNFWAGIKVYCLSRRRDVFQTAFRVTIHHSTTQILDHLRQAIHAPTTLSLLSDAISSTQQPLVFFSCSTNLHIVILHAAFKYVILWPWCPASPDLYRVLIIYELVFFVGVSLSYFVLHLWSLLF
jgi:hypothetical protein